MIAVKCRRIFLIFLLIGASVWAAQAAVVTVYEDDFAHITSGKNTSTSGCKTSYLGEIDGVQVYTVDSAYYADGAIKLGKGTATGSLTTTNLMMQAGLLHIQVDVKGWTSVEGDLLISVAGQTNTCVYTAVMAAPVFETLVSEFAVEAGAYTVTFQTSKKRAFIDNIKITQQVLSSEDEPFFRVNLESSTTVQELSEAAMTVSATVRNTAVVVEYTDGLPEGANYSFDAGAFSWQTRLGDFGDYTLVFTAMGGDDQPYTIGVDITVQVYPLTAPVLTAEDVSARTFDISWEPVLSATEGYVVNVWTGSGATNTPISDVEPFYATVPSGMVVVPLGWTLSGVQDAYSSSDPIELKFESDGDYIVTKTYPKAVTNLSFHVKGYATKNTSDSRLNVYASELGDTWTLVATYSSLSDDDGDDQNNICTSGSLDKSIPLSFENNWCLFKFEYMKADGNIGVGKIAAYYEGAGTKFVGNWKNTPISETMISVIGVRPACDYCAIVGAKNSTEIQDSVLGLRTLETQPGTLLLMQ